MSDYSTIKVNPSCPVIKLQIGDLDLTLENSPEMAKYLFGFSMNRSSEDSANDCVFRLFDETALLLEYAILQGYKDVHFQYGMHEANLSKKFTAIIKDYTIEFTGGGNIILDLQVAVGADTSSDASQEYSNNPGEAFKKVCEEEGWTVGEFTPTKDTEKEALLRTAQTATDFIKDVLIPDAVSEDGKNDYYFWTDTSEEGDTVANFTPKGDFTESSEYKVYEIVIGGGNDKGGLQSENIISFEPSFNGLFYNFFNEGGSVGETTGDTTEDTLNNTDGEHSSDGDGTMTYSLRNTRTNLSYGTTVSGWASRDCGLYEGTSRETNMLAQVPKGAEVIMSGETPAWYRVEYGGKKGYILKTSITTDDPDGNNSENDMPLTDATIDDQNKIINAIQNGGMSNPAYILEVPTIDSLTNEIINPYTDNGIIRRVGSSTYTSEEMGRVAEYMWTQSQTLANTAQLVLRGDPSLTTMSFVAIVVLTPDGLFHHSSGLYQVLEISDDIDGGEYTTTLNLLKLGLQVNADGSISVRDPSQVLFPEGIGNNGSGGNNGGNNGNGNSGGGGTVDPSDLKSICDQYNGCDYSQANRTGPNSYDCSSLVNAIMGDLGIKVNWATTAQGVQKVGNGEWGEVIWSSKSGQTLTADMIPPGAIFVYNNGSSGHTGIFVDSSTVFHASSPTKGVLYTSGSYYINYLNNYSGTAYVVIPPASSGSPVSNNGIKSRIN